MVLITFITTIVLGFVAEVILLQNKVKYTPTWAILSILQKIVLVLRYFGRVWAIIGSVFTVIDWGVVEQALRNFGDVVVHVICLPAQIYEGYIAQVQKYASPNVVKFGNITLVTIGIYIATWATEDLWEGSFIFKFSVICINIFFVWIGYRIFHVISCMISDIWYGKEKTQSVPKISEIKFI